MNNLSGATLLVGSLLAVAGCASSKSLLEREQQACRNALNPSVPPFGTQNGPNNQGPYPEPDPTPPALPPETMADCMHSWNTEDSMENTLTEEEKRKLGL